MLEQIYQLCEEAGTDLAQSLTQKQRTLTKAQAAMPVNVAKALGRISGTTVNLSLIVLIFFLC